MKLYRAQKQLVEFAIQGMAWGPCSSLSIHLEDFAGLKNEPMESTLHPRDCHGL